MSSAPLYDRIGQGYLAQRQPEPAVQRALQQALGEVHSVLNVGAGSGSYEPQGPTVVAVEPSRTMIAQRAPQSAPVVQAVAEDLPFANGSFDACMGVLTMHHWENPKRGLLELLRVARQRVVLLTWVPEAPFFWLYDYFPQLWTQDQALFPEAQRYREWLPEAKLVPVPIPKQCRDGFLGAYWARPKAYLDEAVRASMSTFTKIDARRGVQRLAKDLESGRWEERYGSILRYTHLDLGYRLLCIEA